MFEAKLLNGNILKKIVEAIKDVVNDVNIDVSPSGTQLSCQSGRIQPLPMNCILNFEFRSFPTSYGRLPRCACQPKSQHGRF